MTVLHTGVCRRCGRDGEIRSHDLCGRCHYQEWVTRKDFCGCPPRPPHPCLELPGTPAKIQCLAERAAARQALWHPGDLRRWQLPEPPWSQRPDEVEVEK
jgi:hypothetical protein